MLSQVGDPHLKPMNISLQMVGRSIKYLQGVQEDVLVEVLYLFFPTNFVALDMEEDEMVPIILVCPSLHTTNTLVDVELGELMMSLFDEKITFNIYKKMKHPMNSSTYFWSGVIQHPVEAVNIQEEPQLHWKDS